MKVEVEIKIKDQFKGKVRTLKRTFHPVMHEGNRYKAIVPIDARGEESVVVTISKEEL